jgi:copper homeostasis protein
MIREACVESIREALRAEALGAERIELCDNLIVGGTTPSAGTILAAKKHLRIPIVVLIRPRGGDFVFDDVEIEAMEHDIGLCKKAGVEGVAIGVLTDGQKIDLEVVKHLEKLAKPLKTTFHKAIDDTNDLLGEFEKLHQIGIDSVLTSGGEERALDGLGLINEMAKITKGRIKIIAGGKIKESNLQQHAELFHTDEFHGRLIVGPLNS